MRTTLELSDELLAAARSAAAHSKKSIGAVISEWALKGLGGATRMRKERGIPVFDVPPDTSVITSEMVTDLLADEDLPSRR